MELLACPRCGREGFKGRNGLGLHFAHEHFEEIDALSKQMRARFERTAPSMLGTEQRPISTADTPVPLSPVSSSVWKVPERQEKDMPETTPPPHCPHCTEAVHALAGQLAELQKHPASLKDMLDHCEDATCSKHAEHQAELSRLLEPRETRAASVALKKALEDPDIVRGAARSLGILPRIEVRA